MTKSNNTPDARRYGDYGDVFVEGDGDMQLAHFADFANIQESDCAFGVTDIDAIANLLVAVRDAFPAGSPRVLDAARTSSSLGKGNQPM